MQSSAIESLVNGEHGSPFDILGPHPNGDAQISIRALRPTAKTLTVVVGSERYPMEKVHEDGLFEVTVPGEWPGLDYEYEADNFAGSTETFKDPYAFASQWGEMDIYLFGEGRFRHSYEKMGAHALEIDGVAGVNFSVWAPNAYKVAVVGNFNNWDGRVHAMRMLGNSGIWELFIPEAKIGDAYKYQVRSHHMGYQAEKADPYGFFAEHRPKTASIVVELDNYEWSDEKWMQVRRESDLFERPMLIYEMHLGSWKRKGDHGQYWLSYREMIDDLVAYLKDLGYTHVELMPVAEHPLDGSWGYQVTGYFAPTSRFGSPEDFKYFVDVMHQNGIGVILDWVPAHFPKDGFALSYFDGTHLYSHEDSRRGEHPDWGTYIFNYGRNEVRNFLISNALYWLKMFHIDGLRVDAVSSMLYLDFGREHGQWLPNQYGGNENLDAIQFMQEANAIIHEEFPGVVTIAEESTSWPMVSRPTYLGGLGFTYKWNMGWMHDTLSYMKKNPIYRRYHHNQMTFSMMYAYTENFILALSHDEVVHLKGSIMEKMPGDWWQKFASVRLLQGYQIAHPGKKLNFMGEEIGQWREWSEDRSLDWHLLEQFETHQRLYAWFRDVNQFYKSQPALWEVDFSPEGHEWIEPNDADNSIFSFIRYAKDKRDFIVIICNFTPVPRDDYRIGVPIWGEYRELLNSDSGFYGGGNVGNNGAVHSEPVAWHQFSQSLRLRVPPLGIVFLKHTDYA